MLFVNIRQTPGTQPYCHSRFLTSALPIYGRYDWDRPDPRHDGYYADNYYRNDRRYRERRLSNDDRIYRGRDGKYYCRRNDGSTGLIVGGIAGGVGSEEHTSELQSLMRISYAVFCLKKKKKECQQHH